MSSNRKPCCNGKKKKKSPKTSRRSSKKNMKKKSSSDDSSSSSKCQTSRIAPPSLSCAPSVTSSTKDMNTYGVVGGLDHPYYQNCPTENGCPTTNSSDDDSSDEQHPYISSLNDSDSPIIDCQCTGIQTESLIVRNSMLVRGSLASGSQVRQPRICTSGVCSDTLLTNRTINGTDGCLICLDDIYMTDGCLITGVVLKSFQICLENGALTGLRAFHAAPSFKNISNVRANISTKLILLRYRACSNSCCSPCTYRYTGHYVMIQQHYHSIEAGAYYTTPTSYMSQPNNTVFNEPSNCECTVGIAMVDGPDIDKIMLVSTSDGTENSKIGTFRLTH